MKKTVLAVLFVIIATLSTLMSAPVLASPSATYCGITWGSGAKVLNQSSTSTITNVRTGESTCYDRMVIDESGPASGYSVSYVSAFYSEGQGKLIPLQGGAKLRVIALAPAYSNGKPTYNAVVGQTLPNVNIAGYQTFRDLKYGGSFEGQTSFGLGVRALLPFRVFQLDNRLVIDVAHHW